MFMWHGNVQQGIEWKFLQLNFRCTVIVYALEYGNIFALSNFSQSLLAFLKSAHEIYFLFIVQVSPWLNSVSDISSSGDHALESVDCRLHINKVSELNRIFKGRSDILVPNLFRSHVVSKDDFLIVLMYEQLFTMGLYRYRYLWSSEEHYLYKLDDLRMYYLHSVCYMQVT